MDIFDSQMIEIPDRTYARLRTLADLEKLDSIQEAIDFLLDLQQIPVNRPGPGYREWLGQLVRIGDEQGEEAAMEWMKQNPYRETE